MRRRISTKPSRRSAFVMIAVLVLLVVTTSLATSWTTGVLRSRRQIKLHLMQRQAERLSEAAIGRAVARLKSEPDYVGEVWRQSKDDLGQNYAAEVQIRIEAKENDKPRRIVAQATLPPGADTRVRHTATQQISISSVSTPPVSPTSPGDSTQ